MTAGTSPSPAVTLGGCGGVTASEPRAVALGAPAGVRGAPSALRGAVAETGEGLRRIRPLDVVYSHAGRRGSSCELTLRSLCACDKQTHIA